jgi:S-DNA-T family DNA segregation ATPase FtsK/SpoIIIE
VPANDPKGKPEKKEKKSDPDERLRQVTAILLFLSATLLLLALVSYTPLDQANADVSVRELPGLLSNNPAVSAMADTTENWLGLLGAFIANFLVNSTIGYGTIAFPLLIALWGWVIFRAKDYRRATRITLYSLLVLTLVASAFGTMQLVSWMHHPAHEWSGSVGAFISALLTRVIGAAGSFLVILSTLFIALIYFFDLDVRAIISATATYGKMLVEKAEASKSRVAAKLGERADEENRSKVETGTKPSASDIPPADNEPARMVRRMQGAPDDPVRQNTVPTGRVVSEPKISRPVVAPPPAHDQIIPLVTPLSPTARNMAKHLPEIPFPDAGTTANEIADRLEVDAAEPVAPSPVQIAVLHNAPALPPDEPPFRANRLTLNVQEGETDADLETEDAGELIEELDDEEINYIPPSIDMLVPQSEQADVLDEELKENGRILQQKLETFNIQIEDLTVTPGPVVTLYEFVPAAGIKISQIESLADDIALALKARGIRIIAPIPGKGTVGVEIPNHKPAMVRIRSVINTAKFREADLRLPLALGKTTVGEVYCDDLTKMPHLLIAGATGSGKSVGINSILASLLYKMHPRDLKFVIIDPKKIELNLYHALKDHFLAQCPDIDEQIVTVPQNAVIALKSLEMEMDRRYDILAKAKQRNIFDYNRKVEEGAYRDMRDFHHVKLPYIVLVLDELADLMITAAKEVEEPIARLAQLARAIGIHMIVATQRPSVDVITGMIKANFPARIAYQVASKIDSRTILDMNGAEQLLGNGDMLFLPGGMPKPIRLQNAFISTDEVEQICEHIGRQRGYTRPYLLPSIVEKKGKSGSGGSDERDELFEEAARLIVRHQQGSVSLLQRRLKVGYSRAARIVDELEMAGIVGPFDGSKARAVLLESEAELEAYL